VTYGLPLDAERVVSSLAQELGLRATRAALDRDAARAPAAGDVAIVSAERDAETAFQVVSALARAGTRVVVWGPSKDADLILTAMRSGAQEFVVAGDAEGLRRALAPQGNGSADVRGRVSTVFGAKGGLGATTLATNLAASVAHRGERACVVDLDAALGGVCAVLDLAPSYTIVDVVANMRRLDRELIDASVPRHGSGVWVVAPGEEIEAAERLDAATVAGLLTFLRRHYDAVIVDGLHAFDERALAVLDAADRVLLLVTQEVAAVRNAQRCLEVFGKLGYAQDKVHVVLNRFQKGAAIAPAIVEETLRVPLGATVANDFAAIARAVGKGAVLVEDAPRAQVTRDVEALAPLAGLGSVEGARPRSMISRLFSPRTAAHGTR
jgi:pilus assembly protein CpaE